MERPFARRAAIWACVALGLAAVWTVALRVPLVLNARAHLDSDLAVDGLTLLEMTQGHWRWQFPGTPSIGTVPLLLSLPQAMFWGATPETLVSGGAVAAVLVLAATWWLALRTFGPLAASASLVPLTFASIGTIWLSGRITGGHLLAAAWHALAFGLAAALARKGDRRSALALGLVCGLALWTDSMFALTLIGLAVGFAWTVRSPGFARTSLTTMALAGVATLVGLVPLQVGKRTDPYDAYPDQFALVSDPALWAEHGRILTLQCLPRLIGGHLLPDFEAEPQPESLGGPGGRLVRRGASSLDVPAVAVMTLAFSAFGMGLVQLGLGAFRDSDPARRLVAAGLLTSLIVNLVYFILSKNIYDSDNYRYLVTLLIPWAIGFGVWIERLWREGTGGRSLASAVILALAVLSTWDAARWYGRLGWIDGRGVPVRTAPSDPLLDWLKERPEIVAVHGGYWDVYRLAFLSGGKVVGVPYPIYPQRFGPRSRTIPAGPAVLFGRRNPQDRRILDRARRSVAGEERIGAVRVIRVEGDPFAHE